MRTARSDDLCICVAQATEVQKELRGWLTVLHGVHAVSSSVHLRKFLGSNFVISLTLGSASESASEGDPTVRIEREISTGYQP